MWRYIQAAQINSKIVPSIAWLEDYKVTRDAAFMTMPRYGMTVQTLLDWYVDKYKHQLGLRLVARLWLQVRTIFSANALTIRRSSSR